MKAFLGSRLLGSLPTGGGGNWALFCPDCGEVWGRLVGGEGPWSTLTRACRSHRTGGGYGGTYGPVPGSFLWAINWTGVPVRTLLAHMDPGLLRHEAEVALAELGRAEG